MRNKLSEIILYCIALIITLTLSYEFYQQRQMMIKGTQFSQQASAYFCERIKRLESVSYGFQDSKLPSGPCEIEEEQK